MNSNAWHIEPGKLTYRATPGFEARWSTGPEALEGVDGLCWSDEGGTQEDSIHLHHFVWNDSPPSQSDFEALMSEAVMAIDQWIMARM